MQKHNKIKFISCTVQYATNFFKSVCPKNFIDESIQPKDAIRIKAAVLKSKFKIAENL